MIKTVNGIVTEPETAIENETGMKEEAKVGEIETDLENVKELIVLTETGIVVQEITIEIGAVVVIGRETGVTKRGRM